MFKNLIVTLNSIEVHGKENLDKLLGCILTLEQMQHGAESKTEEAPEDGR